MANLTFGGSTLTFGGSALVFGGGSRAISVSFGAGSFVLIGNATERLYKSVFSYTDIEVMLAPAESRLSVMLLENRSMRPPAAADPEEKFEDREMPSRPRNRN